MYHISKAKKEKYLNFRKIDPSKSILVAGVTLGAKLNFSTHKKE